jgi:hypothetical protein
MGTSWNNTSATQTRGAGPAWSAVRKPKAWLCRTFGGDFPTRRPRRHHDPGILHAVTSAAQVQDDGDVAFDMENTAMEALRLAAAL